jgi:protein-serine/threonine kinase
MQHLLCEPEDRLGSQSTVSTTRPNSLIVSVRRSGFFGQMNGGSGGSVDGVEMIKVNDLLTCYRDKMRTNPDWFSP